MGSNHRLSWVCLVLLVASTTFTAASKQECNLLSQTTWSTQTREYCCLIEGLGCPSTSPTTSTTILRIHAPSSVAKIPGPDCYLGTPETWSLWKRNWCCESKGVHCSVELSVSRARETKIRYNCTDRMQLGEKGWSLAKHEYCCTQELLCPYNCQVGLSSWVTWSGGKKEWCCERETIACETHLLAMLNSKSVVTQIDTTIEPVETTLALPTSTTITTVTTATTVTRVTTTTHTITTITTTTSTTTTSTTTATTTIDFVSLRAYDCVSRPVPDWPSDRQLWCCKHAHIGCRSTQTDIYKIVLAASLVVMAALVLGLPLAALTFKNKSVERTITCVENYPVEDEHSYLEVSQSIHRGPNADAMEGHRNQTPLASPDSSTKQSADNGVRVYDQAKAIAFFECLGLTVTNKTELTAAKATLIFMAPKLGDPEIELTHNWDEPAPYDSGRNFGHLAFAVDDIYACCEKLEKHGVKILRPPHDGRMAFVRSPDHISVELLQKGQALAPKEPWKSAKSFPPW